MINFENRMLDVTLVKSNDHKHQIYHTRKLKGPQKLRNVQYTTLLFSTLFQ